MAKKTGLLLGSLLLFGLIILVLLSLIRKAEIAKLASLDKEQLRKSHYSGIDCTLLAGFRTVGDIVSTHQSVCAGERAWFENDPRFCALHDSPDYCYAWLTIKTGDLSLCEKKSKKTGYFWIENQLEREQRDRAWLYDCYRATANWRNDPEICALIPYATDDLRQQCIDYSAPDSGPSYLDYEDNSPFLGSDEGI